MARVPKEAPITHIVIKDVVKSNHPKAEKVILIYTQNGNGNRLMEDKNTPRKKRFFNDLFTLSLFFNRGSLAINKK